MSILATFATLLRPRKLLVSMLESRLPNRPCFQPVRLPMSKYPLDLLDSHPALDHGWHKSVYLPPKLHRRVHLLTIPLKSLPPHVPPSTSTPTFPSGQATSNLHLRVL